jgi:hypothetical protein
MGAARAAPAAAGDGSFKDWTVICDNLRNCEADGFAADDVEKPALLTLTRSGAAGAPAVVTIQLLADVDDAKPGKPLVLAVDGRPVLTVRAGEGGSAKLADAQVGPLLGAARNGTVLSIRVEDNEVGVVSLAGMVAALRYVDDQQKRVGTVTAMVAKGAAPLSAVPPQPALPVVRRAPAVAQTGLPAKPPAGVKALMDKAECDTDQQTGAEPEVHRLSADKVLWQLPCWSGAYNYSSLFVIVDNKGGGARIAPLEGADDGVAVNAGYDPKTRMLSAYNKGRGVGDCGESSEWAWTGQNFAVTHQASMPACHGQADWPTAFQAKVE